MKILKRVSGSLPVNSYFIVNEETNEGFVIDGGVSAEGVLAFAKENNVKLTAMLLTHTHFDHATCSFDLQQAGVKIIVSEEEKDGLSDKSINLTDVVKVDFPPLEADKTFIDGEEFIVAGIKVKAILTPGHTKGSSCFIIEDCLFVGDTILEGVIGRTDLKTGSRLALMASLKKIRELDFDYKLYSGHGDDSTLNFEKTYNPFLAR